MVSRPPWLEELAALCWFCFAIGGMVWLLVSIQREGVSKWRMSAAFATTLEIASCAYYLTWVFRRF